MPTLTYYCVDSVVSIVSVKTCESCRRGEGRSHGAAWWPLGANCNHLPRTQLRQPAQRMQPRRLDRAHERAAERLRLPGEQARVLALVVVQVEQIRGELGRAGDECGFLRLAQAG